MGSRVISFALAVVGVLCVAHPATAACTDIAAFTVEGAADYQCFPSDAGKVNIVLNKPSGEGRRSFVRIVTSNAPHIGAILINNQDPTHEFIVELSGAAGGQAPASIDLIQGFGLANVAITFETTGDVGSILNIQRVFNTTINGNVTGDIKLQVAGGIVPDGPDVPRLERTNITGNFEGNLIISPFALPSMPEAGRKTLTFGIVRLVKIRGRLGAKGGGSVVQVPGLIQGLRVGELNAHVSGGQGALTIAGLDVTRDRGGSGDVNGDIECMMLGVSPVMPHAVNIAGALNARLSIGQSLDNIMTGSEIALGPMGLHGAIIIGAAPPFHWRWDGEITVGGQLIDGPRYRDRAEAMGGGTVGLVPFALYPKACKPAPGAKLRTPPTSIYVAHYGPVTFDRTTRVMAAPLIFEYRSGQGGAWAEIDRSRYHLEMRRGTSRVLRIRPLFRLKAGYEYRVRPNSAGLSPLRCDVPGSSGPLVAPYEYTFVVARNAQTGLLVR